MNLILHRNNTTSFDSNGVGFLADIIKPKVVQELNGQYELSFQYPRKGQYAAWLGDRSIIMAKPDPVTDPQPFRVYRVNPTSKGIISVYARHLAYDLMGIPAAPFTAASASEAMAKLPASAVVDCPFSFSTDKSTSASMESLVPKAIWSLLGGSAGSVLDVYGGEYEFNGYNVHLHERRGTDRGVSIRYGKNLRSLEQDQNCAGCYTGVYPYWTNPDGELVQLPEKVLAAPGYYDYVRIYPLDLSEKFEEKPTEDQLRECAQKYMTDNDIGVPTVSWKIEFVQLEQSDEYKGLALLERVLLGDTVTVEFPEMYVYAAARAVKIDFDPVLERYNSVTLGRVKSNIADTVAKQKQEIEKRPSLTVMQTIAASLSAAMMGAKGGCVRQLDTDGDGMPDEWYIADNPDPALALKVWRFNYMGLAASATGYNGPFIMGATFEDGFLAHMITAANLVAGTIQSRDKETVFIDLDNGIVDLKPVTAAIDGIRNYIRADSTGLNIGAEGEKASLKLSAGILKVLLSGSPVATFDRYGVKAEQADIKTLIIGKFTLSVDKTSKILTLC